MSPLRALSLSLQRTASSSAKQLSTLEFVATSEQILPFFDHLGPVFSVARHEFASKLQTLREAAGAHATLASIVAQDRAAGRATAKNSATRNLHRLVAAITFIKVLFERLARSPDAHLREAASEAYESSLAPFHTGLIRGVVRAGMLTLPSREHFLSALGESEESARPRCGEVVASCSAVVVAVSQLLAGLDFPVSDGEWVAFEGAVRGLAFSAGLFGGRANRGIRGEREQSASRQMTTPSSSSSLHHHPIPPPHTHTKNPQQFGSGPPRVERMEACSSAVSGSRPEGYYRSII